ncbi:MAG: rhomboid family intramembrane serine protease [Puniceicoccales bacterium]
MSDSSASHIEPDPLPPSGVFAIGPYRRRRRAEEHGLVILSMGLSYELREGPAGFFVWVDEAQADAIYEQLKKFQAESKRWPPKAFMALPGDYPAAPLTLLAYAVVLVAFFAAQSQWSLHLERLGAMDNRLLFAGQWARPFTALTLHGDLGHLISNLVSGLCFGYLINRTLGAALGWSLVVAASFLGNVLNAWFYWPEVHLSIGASTAIFGALGILVGHAIAGKFMPGEGVKLTHRATPLFAGIVILLLTGFAEGNVDVMAHVFGFAAGVPLGTLGFWLAKRFPKLPTSRILLAAPLVALAVAWGAVVI